MTIQEAVKRVQDTDFSNEVEDFSQFVYSDVVNTILNAITYDDYVLCRLDEAMETMDEKALGRPKMLTVATAKKIVKEACK